MLLSGRNETDTEKKIKRALATYLHILHLIPKTMRLWQTLQFVTLNILHQLKQEKLVEENAQAKFNQSANRKKNHTRYNTNNRASV
jgi:hypothetical protein